MEKSNIQLFAKELLDKSNLGKKGINFEEATLDKHIGKIYRLIERDFPEHIKIQGVLASVRVYNSLIADYHGVLLLRDKIMVYTYKYTNAEFNRRIFDYELNEYNLKEIKISTKKAVKSLKGTVDYQVSINHKDDEIAFLIINNIFIDSFSKKLNELRLLI